MSLLESMISLPIGTQFKTIVKVPGGERLGDYKSNGWEIHFWQRVSNESSPRPVHTEQSSSNDENRNVTLF